MPYQHLVWAVLRDRLADRYDGVPFWTEAEALLAINEGLLVWNLCTGRWQARTTLTTVAGQVLYTVPAALLWRTRIACDNHPLSPSNRVDLNNGRYRWRSETTASGGGVPSAPAVWVPVGLRTFYLWPIDAAGGRTLTIDGIAATPVLGSDASYLDLGDEQVAVLLSYALHVLTFTKGGAAFRATQPFLQQFLAAAAEENGQIRSSQTYRRLMGLDSARTALPLHTPTGLDRLAQASPAGGAA